MTFKVALGALVIALGAAAGAAAQAPARAPTPPAAAPAPQPTRAEGVAAIVNDEVISTFDVSQRVGLMLYLAGVRPTAEYLEQLRLPALRALVDEHLQLQELKSRKLTVTDKEIEGTLSDFARQRRTTLDGVQRELAAVGVGMPTLRMQAEASIGWRRLMNGLYGSRIRISPAQLNEVIARAAADASKPQYWLSVIELPATSPTEQEEAQKVALSVIDALKRGADFSRVAAQVSAAPSAAAGGDMGWLPKAQIKPAALQNVVDTLQPGQLSSPISAEGAIYIVALRDKRAGSDALGMKVTLKQISAAPAQRAALERFRGNVKSCEAIPAALTGATGLEQLDLGEVEERELNDDMAKVVAATPVGAASALFENGGKVRTVVVCTREAAGGTAAPNRDQVQNKLIDDEISMLSDRYLRNLYRDATVMTPTRQQ